MGDGHHRGVVKRPVIRAVTTGMPDGIFVGLSRGIEKGDRRICALEKKPTKGITPTSESDPTRKEIDVGRIWFHRPPYLRMSCSSCMAWIPLPAAMKSRALKNA